MCISSNGSKKFPLSSEAVCFCGEDDGCNGGQLYTAWAYIQDDGCVSGGTQDGSVYCSDFSLPHCHHHGPQGSDPYPAEGTAGCPQQSSPQCKSDCDSNAQSPHDSYEHDRMGFTGMIAGPWGVQAIMEMIYEGGPVETAFTVYGDFALYTGGIYSHQSGIQEGGHAVRIVGWGTEDGVDYWKVANSWNPYWGEEGYFRIVKGTDECGIEDMVSAAPNDAVWMKKSLNKVTK